MSDYAVFENTEVKSFLFHMDKKLKGIKGGDFKYRGLLSAIVYADVIDHFRREEGDKGPWKNLYNGEKWSKGYKKYMDKIGKGGNNILQDTGRLRNNFKPDKVKKIQDGYLWFNDAQTNSGFPYAAAHDQGGPSLPQRKFMWLSKNAMNRIGAETLQFLIQHGV
jgi:phage gpG-like protein